MSGWLESLSGNYDTTDPSVVSTQGCLGRPVGIGRATSPQDAQEIAQKLSDGTPSQSFGAGSKTYLWGVRK